MKKIILVIVIVLALASIFTISYFKSPNLTLYSLPMHKAYVYNDNEKMNFYIYSNQGDSYVTKVNSNEYYLVLETEKYILEDVSIEIIKDKKLYLYLLQANIPPMLNGISNQNIKLQIINSVYSYELDMGSLSILNNEEYKLLSIDSLYASYSYLNGSLKLVGINITFSHIYSKLKSLRIGNYMFADLSKAIPDCNLNNEIDILEIVPDYDPLNYNTDEIELTSQTYFFPITYQKILLAYQGFITLNLDGENYYLDTFNFFVNMISYSDYKEELEVGRLLWKYKIWLKSIKALMLLII